MKWNEISGMPVDVKFDVCARKMSAALLLNRIYAKYMNFQRPKSIFYGRFCAMRLCRLAWCRRRLVGRRPNTQLRTLEVGSCLMQHTHTPGWLEQLRFLHTAGSREADEPSCQRTPDPLFSPFSTYITNFSFCFCFFFCARLISPDLLPRRTSIWRRRTEEYEKLLLGTDGDAAMWPARKINQSILDTEISVHLWHVCPHIFYELIISTTTATYAIVSSSLDSIYVI